MNRRGFTLVELAVVIGMVAVLVAVGVGSWRSMRKNVAAGDAAFEIAATLDGLRVTAMREGVAYGGLVMDAVNNDPAMCQADSRNCLRVCALPDVPSTWSAATSDPFNVSDTNCATFSDGVRFELSSPRSPPAPFAALVPNDAAVVQTVGGRRVLAVRFDTNGNVSPAIGAPSLATGVAIALSTDAINAAATRIVVLSFPYGLTKTYSY